MAGVFVPRDIRVGFQNRQDTYTGKLAYVTYLDDKGKLRKESSWQGWRDKTIDILEEANEPTSGFVLNKKVGGVGYSQWDARQTYVRVFDPRGFEFEITIPNLLYVLENASSIKGKGLDGEFVYGWDGTELLLIPIAAPDYPGMIAARDTLFNKETVKAKDLVLGGTYKNRAGQDLIYMGRFQKYDRYYGYKKESKPAFFFQDHEPSWNKTERGSFIARPSISGYFIATVDVNPSPEYSNLFDRLEQDEMYSPHDPKKDTLVPYTEEEFGRLVKTVTNSNYYGAPRFFAASKKKVYSVIKQRKGEYDYRANQGYSYYNTPRLTEDRYVAQEYDSYRNNDLLYFKEPAEAFQALEPHHKDLYLSNDKFYKREY